MRYVWRRQTTLQVALNWWWERQVMQAYDNAENLRDRVLQESFALRRNLELSHAALAADTALADWQTNLPRLLTSANRLHEEVQQLSDQLSSPFLSDSLPLAIRHLVAAWEKAHPAIHFALDLPQDWSSQNAVQQDILTKIIDACLQLCFADLSDPQLQSQIMQADPPCELAIALSTTATTRHTLEIRLAIPAPLQDGIVSRRQYFRYLGQVFQTLMPGRYTLKLTPHRLCFRGRWQSF